MRHAKDAPSRIAFLFLSVVGSLGIAGLLYVPLPSAVGLCGYPLLSTPVLVWLAVRAYRRVDNPLGV